MARNETQPLVEQDSVQALVATKLAFLVPMTIIFMTSYIGLTVLAGFAKGLMAVKIVGSVNLGFVLIAVNYLISWVLALVYQRVANDRFDPLASKIAARVLMRRSAP